MTVRPEYRGRGRPWDRRPRRWLVEGGGEQVMENGVPAQGGRRAESNTEFCRTDPILERPPFGYKALQQKTIHRSLAGGDWLCRARRGPQSRPAANPGDGAARVLPNEPGNW
jgi:hypothetical protein